MLCDLQWFFPVPSDAIIIPKRRWIDVQICGRLVHDIDLRLNGLSGGDGYLLPHSIGQCVQAVIQRSSILLYWAAWSTWDWISSWYIRNFHSRKRFLRLPHWQKIDSGGLGTHYLPASRVPRSGFPPKVLSPTRILPAQLPLIEIGDQPLITRVKELFSASGWASQYDYFPPARMSSVT